MSKPAPTRRRLSAAERRLLIEQAATELFAERGYRGAGVEEIARRAGVTVPVLYDHFGSKQQLYRRLLEASFAGLREIWAGVPLEPGAARDRQVGQVLDAWFAYVESHPFAWRMLFRETTGDPAIAAMHEEVAVASRAALLPMMAAGMPGADRADVEMAWEAVRGVIQGLALWWHDNRDVPRERVVAAAMNALWLGLERVGEGRRWPASI